MRPVLALVLLCYSLSTTSAGLGDYLYRAWDEERWSCTKTDRAEHTCGLQIRKPKWGKK